jgi:hypothetical protein
MPSRTRLRCTVALCAAALAGLALTHAPRAMSNPRCSATSPAFSTPVVELYTSEGCNSCPPADRWLSRLKGQPGVVALAFHVDYWDRLGWKDRFASPAYTQRHAQQQAVNGARFSYTPQVVLDGIDQPRWGGVSPEMLLRGSPSRPDSSVHITLTRDGAQVSAVVHARPGAAQRLSAYWALTEDGHRTAVKAGENEGVTLQHDFVVRRYLEVAPWSATAGAPTVLRFDIPAASPPGQPQSVSLVVLDAATRRPVQAVKLGC